MSACPSCLEPAISASGSNKSKILIIGGYPDEKDMENRRPFSNNAGTVLRKEFAREGVDLIQCQMTNIWMHIPNKNKNCFDAGFNQALEHAKGKQAILLIGPECADTFIGLSVSDICGLEVESPMLSAPLVMSIVNPTNVYAGGVGEVRLAVQKFIKRLKEMEIV